MPVRIYDIAKKLGLESKVVLAKAKELGITHAKVASSTLDKITAEYLETSLTPEKPAEAAPEAVAVAAAPPSDAAPPAVGEPATGAPVDTAHVTGPADGAGDAHAHAHTHAAEAVAPPPPVSAVPATSAPAAVEHPPAPVAPEVPSTPIPAPVAIEPSPVVAPPPAAPEPVGAPVEAAVESSSVAPGAVVAEPAAPADTAEQAKEAPARPSEPAPAPVAEVPPPVASPTPAPAPAGVPPPPPAPPAPPKAPGLGELVGRIELPFRGRPGSRSPAPPPPPPPAGRRPEPPRPAPPGQRSPGAPMAPNRPGMSSMPPRPGGPMGPGRSAPGGPSRPGQPPGRYGAPMSGRSGPAPSAPPPPSGGGGKSTAVPDFTAPSDGQVISIKPPIIVRDLAERMGVKAYRILHDLMELGVFANLNQAIDEKVAQFIAARHGFRFEVERREKGAGQVHAPAKKVELDIEDKVEDLKPRPPVIVIMGHVDHGKTSLLDVIRKANVAAREAGGITQHIGAYTIQVPHPERPAEMQQLTFLDTPGHAAFSAMRARGANVTDIVILVVAASEGVMPQTLEALSHAKAARVPIMVAVNKCDLPAANPLRTRQQLQEHGLVPEEWGGETIYVDVSATTKVGIDKLLAMLVLQAEVMELKSNPNRRAKGNVIESGLEPGGPTATVLVRKGTLRLGDVVICGSYYGRTRALINEEGQRLKEAGPSVAVKILGLNGVPEAGLEFSVVENEKIARQLAEEREEQAKAAGRERGPRVTLENLLSVIEQQSAKVLKVLVKADTQGSVEAIVEALKKQDSAKVSLEVVHSAVGTISKDDVMLAASAKGIVVGFHTRMDNGVPAIAKREGVQIKQYEIIYELIDEVRLAMAGLLDPELKEVTLGSAEVRQIFELSKGGKVAGCMVTHGRIVRGKARIVRRKEVIHDGVIGTLRRFQDEVNEVRSGMECGIRVSSWDEFQNGDVIESYTVEKVAQQL